MIDNIAKFLDTIDLNKETAVLNVTTLAYKNFAMMVLFARKNEEMETSVGVQLDKENKFIQTFPKIGNAWHGELGDFVFDVEETEDSIILGYTHVDGTTCVETVSKR